jgi:hypothetical protein
LKTNKGQLPISHQKGSTMMRLLLKTHLLLVVFGLLTILGARPVAAQSYGDGFEGSAINSFWTAQTQFGSVVLSNEQSHGGSQSVKFSSISGGQREIHLRHTSLPPSKGTFSIYFYDAAPGQETLYEKFNLYNSAQPNLSVSLGTQDFDALCYSAGLVDVSGVVHGPEGTCGVYPQTSTTNVQRTLGWHRFEVNVATDFISLAIDGQSVFVSGGDYSFDTIDLSVSGPAWRPDTAAYFDDFSFSAAANDGSIAFSSPMSYSVGRGPNGLAAADFNHDGIQDLVAVNAADNTFSYLQGNGDGTFRAPTNFSMSSAAGALPSAITAADFNRDGNFDLAVTHPTSTASGFGNTVTIHIGDGAGRFSNGGTFTTGGSDTDITGGDFNEDGKADLAVGACDQQSVFVHLGNGDGTFRLVTQVFVGGCGGGSLLSVTATDFNDDRHLDLVASGIGDNTVTSLPGNGAGGFGQPKVSSVDRSPIAAAAGDFNRDGKLDLAVASFNEGVVDILGGDGGGSFTRAGALNVGRAPLDVWTADFNEDGDLDLLVTNTQSDGVSVLPGVGGGQFNEQLTFDAGSSPPVRAAVSDFNRDGLPDVAVTNSEAGTVSVLLNSTVRTLRTVRAIDTSAAPGSQVSIAFELSAHGDESGLSFSVGYDPAVLSNPRAAPGGDADGAALQTNSGQTSQGRFGVLVAFPGGRTFAAGTRQVVRVTFDVAQTQAASTTLSFTDQPTLRGVSDSIGNLLPANFQPGTISITPGYEADVAPRPKGGNDGTVNVGDFVQMGRFAIGVDTPVAGGEFQRADCAPRATKGDGRINAGDFVQAGRYAVGIDAVVAAGGPTSPTLATATSELKTAREESSSMAAARVVRIVGVSAPPGSEVSVGVEMESQGDESAASFSLEYDPALLSDPRVIPGGDAYGAVVQANLNQAVRGHLGVLVGFLGGQTFPTGTRQIAMVTFKVAQIQATGVAINFSDQPTTRSISDADGDLLPMAFSPGLITINPDAGNRLDDPQFFASQHYLDFLNRAPDESGLNFWINQITSCGNDRQCVEVKRVNVSAAFFLSIEFQNTGYLVYRTYKAAYGDATSPNVPGTVPVLRLSEFLPDTQSIGRSVVVGRGDWEKQLESNKQVFALEFVQRQRFLEAYPPSMTPAQFVDKLRQNTAAAISQTERDQLVSQLNSDNTTAGRAAVLRSVAEDADLQRDEFNRAFVLMQYYGYLRRDPDSAPDSDFRGWKFWLDKLNQFRGNFVSAEMVKAFLTSDEYRHRLGR